MRLPLYNSEFRNVRLRSKSNVMQWSYDTLDHATGKRYHDGTTEAYAYAGGLLSQTRGTRGQVVSYSYDANGNTTLIDYPNMADVSLSYNALDQVSQVSDGVGTHTFNYDDYGRLLSQSGPFANDTQTYAYDALQRLSAQSVGRGASGGTQSQSYSYDALGRLSGLTSNGTQGVGAFAYHYVGLTGMLSRLDMPNGTHTDQSYDSLQRLTSVVNQNNAGANLDRYAYVYSNRDVRTGVMIQHGAEAIRQVAYAYDGIDQLTGEQVTGGAANTAFTKTYAYDAMGNRTQTDYADANQSVRTVSATNPLNQLKGSTTTSNVSPTTSASRDYDAAGNLTQTLGSDGSKTLYTYDDSDRLTRLEKRNAAGVPTSASEWVYDYASRKPISREFTYAGGAWTQTSEKRRVFDGMDVVQERNASNEVTAQLVRDGNIGGILSRTTAGGASFYGYDGNGNVTLLTDATGADVAHYRYDAFGQTLEASGARAAENPYRFSSKELHAASGLYDFGYRFYSAGLGRWINRDPISETGGVNLYAMVGNDPVNSVDAYGLAPKKSLPTPGSTVYPTMDAAAIAALQNIYVKSNKEGYEWGGEILKTKGGYKPTKPTRLGEDGGTTAVSPNSVGSFHTHPSTSRTGQIYINERFSPEDIQSAEDLSEVTYVRTPTRIIKYDSKTNRQSVIWRLKPQPKKSKK